MIGQTVSHYRIIENKAEDTKLLRFVALKFLPDAGTRTLCI
jgi:hypothetical protein